MKKKVVALGLAIMLFVSICTQASAYSLWGYKWSSKAIYYEVHSNASGVNNTAFTGGIGSWNTNTNVTLISSSVNKTVYCNVISMSTVDWDGLCSPYVSGSLFSEVFCFLNTYYTGSYSANKRQSVAAHEIGHALGLADLSSGSTALMNGYTYYRYDTNGVYTVQTDDKNGVNYLYP